MGNDLLVIGIGDRIIHHSDPSKSGLSGRAQKAAFADPRGVERSWSNWRWSWTAGNSGIGSGDDDTGHIFLAAGTPGLCILIQTFVSGQRQRAQAPVSLEAVGSFGWSFSRSDSGRPRCWAAPFGEGDDLLHILRHVAADDGKVEFRGLNLVFHKKRLEHGVADRHGDDCDQNRDRRRYGHDFFRGWNWEEISLS